MCGIAGMLDLWGRREAERSVIERMLNAIVHRGPDSQGVYLDQGIALGMRRLSIVDTAGGDQPHFCHDTKIVSVCQGEIFNHRELRAELLQQGHVFRSSTDVEVVPHLYKEYGLGVLDKLDGQFAFAVWDEPERRLLLARDPFGVAPLYWTVSNGVFVFASEIKAILRHPGVARAVDLTSLDQVLSFPGIVSPRTIFRDIRSLRSGHYLLIQDGKVEERRYWDLDYPPDAAMDRKTSAQGHAEALRELLRASVRKRMQGDSPVGVYLSGGLDSSFIAACAAEATNTPLHSFSIGFREKQLDERAYQRQAASAGGFIHHEREVGWNDLAPRFRSMVWHAETPVKESYNACALALSELAREVNCKAVLAGEGADELFAGYPGYRFDRLRYGADEDHVEIALEQDIRDRLWGNRELGYDLNQHVLRDTKIALYSESVGENFEQFDCVRSSPVDKSKLAGRDQLHQRSYLDFHLRLVDHLLIEHGDHMALANSVEVRFPFLDRDLVNYARTIPQELKLRNLEEKFIVKQAALGMVSPNIVNREKHGFVAPASPELLRSGLEWVEDLLSYERVKRQGYFNPDTVERIKTNYRRPSFSHQPHIQNDLVTIVLSFGLLLDLFELPDFAG